jgi:hypothetical protein
MIFPTNWIWRLLPFGSSNSPKGRHPERPAWVNESRSVEQVEALGLNWNLQRPVMGMFLNREASKLINPGP